MQDESRDFSEMIKALVSWMEFENAGLKWRYAVQRQKAPVVSFRFRGTDSVQSKPCPIMCVVLWKHPSCRRNASTRT